MGAPAKITVTSGPDRGQSFVLDDDLVHIGSGADNQVALSDPAVPEYQVSIARRSGRYAIYAPQEGKVEVDGNVLPPECWVWLPASARIRISERTSLQFTNGNAAAAPSPPPVRRGGPQPSAPPEPPATAPAPARPAAEAAAPRQRPGRTAKRAERKKAVAKFITDRSGDTLVRLGEDGHLPELQLVEGPERARAEKKVRQSNPVVIYAAVGFSFLFSMALLFIDEGTGTASSDIDRARREIVAFYGGEGEQIQPYQQHLREARLARSRGDRAAERRAYRKVLDLLNSEDNNPITGVTGSRVRDDELRRLIALMLSE